MTVTDEDGDTLTYTHAGTDGHLFDINGTSGQLTTKVALNYEDDAEHTVTVTASDGDSDTNDTTITVIITVVDKNDAPEFLDAAKNSITKTTRTVAEDAELGTSVGVDLPVEATDEDGDTLTYTLGGPDGGSDTSFVIESDGQLKTIKPLNYEDKHTYTVTVSVSDSKDADFDDDSGTPVTDDTIIVTIEVTDENEAPFFEYTATQLTALGLAIDENTVAGRSIGSPVRATDPEGDRLTYSLDTR